MIDAWLAALEARHLADLTFSEVTRALRALSSTYVERRARLAERGAFDSAGKRAAYALYYSPLHLLTVAHIVEQLGLARRPARHLFDLGCGAGAAGAAWASQLTPPARVTGVDAHSWAVGEAAWTYRTWRLTGDTRRVSAARIDIPRHADGIVAGWVLNELPDADRLRMQAQLLEAAARGAQVLVVEPIATRVSPWWEAWAEQMVARGARADEWRITTPLPPLVSRFAKAAGLRQDALRARSICLM